jgi:transcription elongation factor GreA
MNNTDYFSVTKEGYEKLNQEYEELLKQRPDAVEHLKKSRELGDLSENGYYKASRAKLSSIDSRLFHLKSLLKKIRIVETFSTEVVSLGCNVTLKNGESTMEYRIVSRFEANPSEGKVSDVSPIGKALLGKQVGATIEIDIPAGIAKYLVVKITV